MKDQLHYLPALIAVLATACGGSSKPPASAPEAPVAAETATAAPLEAKTEAPSPAVAPAKQPKLPEFEPTPPDQLKAHTKAALTTAAKLAKPDQPWSEALSALTKKLGPQTYIGRASDPEAPFSDTYYWTAGAKGGGCDALYLQATTDRTKVLEIAMTKNAAGSSTSPDRGGPPIDPCTGQPAK